MKQNSGKKSCPRLRNVAQYQRVSIRIEQLDEEIEKLEEVNDESNKTKLGLLKEDREKTKQQLESIELDPYQFIIKVLVFRNNFENFLKYYFEFFQNFL